MTGKKKDFLVGLGVGAAIALAVIWGNPQQVENWPHRLCNGFFVPAVILLGVGGLKLARNKGTFDMMAYGLKTVFHTHLPAMSIGEARDTPEDFVEYSRRKAEKRKSPAGLLLSGLVYLVLAVAMLILYNMQP